MNYTFAPEIWGTVSDWIMIFVTFTTAFLLLLTLKSQKEVQRMQNELFRIESIRFKESIKPILKFTAYKHQPKTDDKDKKIFTLEIKNETSGTALQITRLVETNEMTKQLFGPDGLDGKRNHLTKGDKPILLHFGIDSETTHYILFTIRYQDVAETKYKQRVLCIYDETYGTEIYPSLPEIESITEN